MADRDKAIKGLECRLECWCMQEDHCNQGCPYLGDSRACRGLDEDALALLKAQPSEDWISRKRLKNEIQYYIDEAGWGDEINKVLGWCLEFIDNQEAVKWE